jgi:MerR-like DNA binding protein
MDNLISTTEAAERCGITARQFKIWRERWPGICDPCDGKGRLELYNPTDVDALLEKRKTTRPWSVAWRGWKDR